MFCLKIFRRFCFFYNRYCCWSLYRWCNNRWCNNRWFNRWCYWRSNWRSNWGCNYRSSYLWCNWLRWLNCNRRSYRCCWYRNSRIYWSIFCIPAITSFGVSYPTVSPESLIIFCGICPSGICPPGATPVVLGNGRLNGA